MNVTNAKQMINVFSHLRLGYQHVKDKNQRRIGHKCLMELNIGTQAEVPETDEIIVNTNSEDAIRIVNECYAVGGG